MPTRYTWRRESKGSEETEAPGRTREPPSLARDCFVLHSVEVWFRDYLQKQTLPPSAGPISPFYLARNTPHQPILLGVTRESEIRNQILAVSFRLQSDPKSAQSCHQFLVTPPFLHHSIAGRHFLHQLLEQIILVGADVELIDQPVKIIACQTQIARRLRFFPAGLAQSS